MGRRWRMKRLTILSFSDGEIRLRLKYSVTQRSPRIHCSIYFSKRGNTHDRLLNPHRPVAIAPQP